MRLMSIHPGVHPEYHVQRTSALDGTAVWSCNTRHDDPLGYRSVAIRVFDERRLYYPVVPVGWVRTSIRHSISLTLNRLVLVGA